MLQHSSIRRFHLFELHDQVWFPAVLRRALTEWLRALWEYSQAANVIAPLLAKAIAASGARQIVDLCSGGSGPIIPIQRTLESMGVSVPAVITDKYPDPEMAAELACTSGSKLSVSLDPVDATALPAHFTGFRTLFNSFHHFRPAEARQIVADAYRCRQPIGIFEITERSLPKVLLCFPASFIGVFLLLARMHPRLRIWWVFTWILPVIPATVAWDGFVSHLRTYTRPEILNLIEGLSSETYRWETGRVAAPRGGVEISFLIGLPISQSQPALQ